MTVSSPKGDIRTVSRYEVRPSVPAPPHDGVVERMATEPGFAARFFLEEYMKWKGMLRMKVKALRRGTEGPPPPQAR